MRNFVVYKFPRYFKPILPLRKISHKRLFSLFFAFLLTLLITKVLEATFVVKIPVFGFHDIVNIQNKPGAFPLLTELKSDYSQQDLEAFLDNLVRDNYWFLSTQELYDYYLSKPSQALPPEHRHQKKVMITFDDGYKSVYTNLLPILEKLENKYEKKIKVVLFVNPGFIGRRGKTLDKANCKELREGFEKGFYDLQSHGLNHENLTKISGKALVRELEQAQIKLRKCTQDLDPNRTVGSHIAYPYGAVNKEVDKYVSKYYLSGYLYNSLSLKLGFWGTNRYRIPRLTANKKHSVQRLTTMAAGGWLRSLIRSKFKVNE